MFRCRNRRAFDCRSPIGYLRRRESIRAPPRDSMSSRTTPASPAPRWRSTRTTPAAASPVTATASTSAPSPRPTRRARLCRNSSIAAITTLSSTPPADTLLKLADWAKGKDILLFNIRATDVSLRQENCRANVMHVVPDRYMLADALAQYLVAMKWTNWLLVHGSTPGDLAYAEAIKRAASRFGANIVDAREYKDVSGGTPRRCRHHSARQAGEQRPRHSRPIPTIR